MAATIVAALAAGGCSPNVLIAVYPCPDGGVAVGATGCTRLLEDLVGYWRLDESTGSTTAQDWSTRGNNGTLVDLDPATVWGPGRAAGGLAVESAGFVNVVPSASIDSITDQVTLAGWAYLDATLPILDYATVASREDGTTIDQHYHISIDMAGLPVFFLKTENGLPRLTPLSTPPMPVARQTWIHIAGTYDGSIARLYVDGREVDSEPITGRFRPDTTPFILGANGNGPAQVDVSERFPGRIDEIMLYRRALSAAEIAQLHGGALFVSPLLDPDAGARD